MEQKNNARLTAIPQLDIPDILVDDEPASAREAEAPTMSRAPSTFLSAEDARPSRLRSWSGASVDISLHDANYAHPLSMPRASGASGGGDGTLTPTTPGGSHRHNTSAFSFEVQDPDDAQLAGSSSRQHDSAVSPAVVKELLDDSAWMASIRRTATTNRRNGY